MYQFFALHALHQRLEKMDGLALAEVEGFLDGGDDISLHPVKKPSVEKHSQTHLQLQTRWSLLMKAALESAKRLKRSRTHQDTDHATSSE